MPFFRGKDVGMTGTLPRLIFVAALAVAGLSPAQSSGVSGLPKHPPRPAPRPVFDSDAANLAAAAAQEASNPQPAEPAPEPAQAPPPQAQANSVAPVITEAALPVATPMEEKVAGFALAEQAGLAELTRQYAHRHGVPLALLHRIIMRESRYHPHLVHRSYYGLMQITPATARSMGYQGAPNGLLDAKTNLHYATPYLANAWALADGNLDRAVQLYASGYYYTAKNKHMLSQMRNASSTPVRPEPSSALALAPTPPSRQKDFFESVFGN
jgi:soluble lytic murein transglycosylase-like protein